jgi:hypothetical protein
MRSSAFAGLVGSRRACFQFRNVLTLTLSSRANSARESFARTRTACTREGEYA